MNKQNQKIILEAIREAADSLTGRLPDSSRHPKGRNAYAHIPKTISSIYGTSYKLLPDDELENVLEIIKHCKENPF